MRVLLVRDVTVLSMRTDHEAGNSRPEAERLSVEFREGVGRALRPRSTPGFFYRRGNMIGPSAPILPGHEHRRLFPHPPPHDRVYLFWPPPRPRRHPLSRVFALVPPAVAVHPP